MSKGFKNRIKKMAEILEIAKETKEPEMTFIDKQKKKLTELEENFKKVQDQIKTLEEKKKECDNGIEQGLAALNNLRGQYGAIKAVVEEFEGGKSGSSNGS